MSAMDKVSSSLLILCHILIAIQANNLSPDNVSAMPIVALAVAQNLPVSVPAQVHPHSKARKVAVSVEEGRHHHHHHLQLPQRLLQLLVAVPSRVAHLSILPAFLMSEMDKESSLSPDNVSATPIAGADAALDPRVAALAQVHLHKQEKLDAGL